MINLRRIFGRARSEPSPPDLFDVYHAKSVAALRDAQGDSLAAWSVADTETLAKAPRFVLGLLRSRPRLRQRFPDALRGGRFQEWLLQEAAREFRLSDPARANLAATFAADLAAPVREFFLHSPEMQWRYPLALLPFGQKRFVKWMLGKGRAQHSFSDEQILWFLQETADGLADGIVLTYLIQPEWQERFPHLRSQSRELLAFLCAQYPRYRPLRKIRELPVPTETAPVRASGALAGINILSHFCYQSGLQQAALGVKAALETVGLRTSCRDVPTGVKTELIPRQPWLGLEAYGISLTNVAPVPHFAARYRRAGLARRPGVRTIVYWAWELDVIPTEWKELAPEIDELWAPTPFVADAMRQIMPVPVYDILPGVSIGDVEKVPRHELGLEGDDFVFFFMFDMCSDFRRKNPLALVRAFQTAFPHHERARLLIKISRGSSDPESLRQLRDAVADRRIIVIDELVSHAKACGYIDLCDAVVSLHRSEGIGLLLAEGMLLGKPVIATNYSGNTAFMRPENSLLVDYDLITITDDGAIYKKGNRWADPSEEHAAQLMRQVYENRAEAAALGLRAQADARELLSVEAAGRRMQARLAELHRRE